MPSPQAAYSLSQHLLATFQSSTTEQPENVKSFLSYPVSHELGPIALEGFLWG